MRPPSLWAVLAILTALPLPLLALSGPTAAFVPLGHAALSVWVCVGSLARGWAGHPDAARRWALGYLVVTLVVSAALEVGAATRGAGVGYWGLPWLGLLVWGWAPPLVAGAAGMLGVARRRRLSRAAVRAASQD